MGTMNLGNAVEPTRREGACRVRQPHVFKPPAVAGATIASRKWRGNHVGVSARTG